MSPFLISSSLLIAVAGKCLRFETFRDSLEQRVGPHHRGYIAAVAVLVLEFSIALSMWTPARQPGALILLIFLHAATVWLITDDSVRHDVVPADCQCFGISASWTVDRGLGTYALKPAWWALRNGVIAGVSIDVVFPTVTIQHALALGMVMVTFGGLSAMTLVIHNIRRDISSEDTLEVSSA